MTLHGVDVSHYQGTIDWAKTGVGFAFIKATQGTTLVDPEYAANVKAARAAGIPVGHYHFAAGGDPAAEAAHFLAVADVRPGEPVALDFEASPTGPGVLGVADPVGWARTWLQAAHGSVIYMNTDVLRRFNWKPLVGFGLWLACPSDNTADPAPWRQAQLRQVGTGVVPGIGRTDLDTAIGGFMLTSYNGFPAVQDGSNIDRTFAVAAKTAAGKSVNVQFPGGVLAGDVATLFQYYEEQFFTRVEKPATGDYAKDGDWGWEYRVDVNDPSQLSCHASGTATDTNATRHPDGSHNTFTPAQYDTLRQIFSAELEHTLRIGVPGFVSADGKSCGWTADSTPDEMHVEVQSFDAALIARVAAKVKPLLGKGAQGAVAPSHPVFTDASITVPGLTVKTVQQDLNKSGAHLAVDGVIGPLTTQAIRAFQAQHGLTIDGIVGPKTAAALEHAGVVHHPAPYPLPGHEVFGLWNYPGTDKVTGKSWESETRSGDPRFDKQSIRNLIKTIQGRLGVAQDGVYGPKTEAAVKAFQKAHKLTVDGLVGRGTWAVLFA